MLTQPLFHDYEYSDFQPGFSTAKQHKLAREVYIRAGVHNLFVIAGRITFIFMNYCRH